jgi:hypothetical protein
MRKLALTPLQFTLLALAASQACAQADAAAENKLEAITISGIRASAQSSVSKKKNAMEVVDAIVECSTLANAPAYSGTIANSCTGCQYQVTKTVNSQQGSARGLEFSGQYFFDGSAGWLKNFGGAA